MERVVCDRGSSRVPGFFMGAGGVGEFDPGGSCQTAQDPYFGARERWLSDVAAACLGAD